MNNAELLLRRQKAVPRGIATATSLFAAEAENAFVSDVEGRRYIDFAGGIGTLNVGHRHPRVVEAVRNQLDRFTHTAFQVMPYAAYIELAERLNALAPVEGEAKTIFFTTGGEATENAVKIARAATGRSGVIAFAGAFHGRTLLASAMTGKIAPYKQGLGPFPPEVYHVPFPSETTGVTLEETVKALNFLFTADIEPSRVAAFILEPVQGEGGFHVPDPRLYEVLREMGERHGILTIADEVQSGIGRTGRMFAVEHAGARPDIVTVAKSLGGGMPISGVIGRSEVMDALDPGGLGGTYGGSPLALVAALEVLDIIEEEGLLERAETIGRRIRKAVQDHAKADQRIRVSGLRGLGAMVAFDVVDDQGRPDGAEAKRVCGRALERGLVLLSCGQAGQAIRILVPLTVSDAVLEDGLAIMGEALRPEEAR